MIHFTMAKLSTCTYGASSGLKWTNSACILLPILKSRNALNILQVKDAFLAVVKKLKVGNPFEDDTYLGPMISESAAKGIEEWVEEAVAKGGKLLAGGKRKGAFMEPTVLENVPMEANARKEEIFGPVVLLYKYK